MLCKSHDIVFLQETWLANDELCFLKNIDDAFYADGISSMCSDKGVLTGRPHGGLGILWRKTLGSSMNIVKFPGESIRVMGIKFDYQCQKLHVECLYAL